MASFVAEVGRYRTWEYEQTDISDKLGNAEGLYGRSLRVARTRDADALWMCHSLGLHTGVFVFCGKGGEGGRCLCLFWTEVITLVDGCWELFTRSRDYKIY